MIGPTFEVQTVDHGSQRHVVVRGEIDIKTAPELETALIELAAHQVVVDLSDVGFIDSTGLRVLAMARSRSDSDGGRLIVCTPEDSPVLRTMRLAGLATDFEVIAHPDELTGAG